MEYIEIIYYIVINKKVSVIIKIIYDIKHYKTHHT